MFSTLAYELAEDRFPMRTNKEIDSFLMDSGSAISLHFVEMEGQKNEPFILTLPQKELEKIAVVKSLVDTDEVVTDDDRKEFLQYMLQYYITPTQRRVVEFHFYKGLSVKTIAKMEGVFEGDIKLCLRCTIEEMIRIKNQILS